MKPSKLFAKVVRDALKHFHNPTWLGQHSPLATPYFLGDVLLARSEQSWHVETCGEVVRELLLSAAKKLWTDELPARRQKLIDTVNAKRLLLGNKGGHYHYMILELRYFRQYFSKFDWPFDSRGITEFLGVSETRYFKHVELAVEALIVELLKLVRPTFRLERPYLLRPIFGRDTLIENCLTQLQNKQAVTLTGMGGIGKTTVGTAIFTQWKISPAFWYTFRTPLNDQYSSVIFSLAHFLNQHQSSALWLQLMADGGRLKDQSQLKGYLIHDLKTQPLLCFDEVDRLLATDIKLGHPEHQAIVELLALLAELTPVMFIGQRPIVDTTGQFTVASMTIQASSQLLAETGEPFEVATVAVWHRISEGNPRFLLLLAMLHINNEPIDPENIDLGAPFQRLWHRLTLPEREMLMSLAVFIAPAPADAWQDQPTLNALIERRLVTRDRYDGVALLPLYRRYLYQYVLSQEMRESFHERAAVICVKRGEYTDSAFHYAKANEPAKALAVWYPHLEIEITRGFGTIARTIFESVSAKRLTKSEQKKLQIVRHRLADLMGDFDAILATAKPRTENTVEDATLDELEGRVLHLMGNSDRGLASYDNALSRLTTLISQMVMVHFRRGQLLMEDSQLQEARCEAQNIFHFYQRLQAIIARRSGDFSTAETAFLAALDSAENLSALQRATIHQELMVLYNQRGQTHNAAHHAQAATQYFVTIGNQFQQWLTTANMASIHTQAGEYAEAIQCGEDALSYFDQLEHTGIPVPELKNTLAEAYFEIGNLPKALFYAQSVLRSEERQLFPYASYTLARIHIKSQKYTFAHHVFQEALQVATENEDIFIQAYLLNERSKLHGLLGKERDKDNDRRMAADLFRKMNLDVEC